MTNRNEIEPFAGNPAVESVSRPPRMLVSVRDLTEFQIVWDALVDIIDLKEPRNGPLAPVDSQIWRTAAELLGDQTGRPVADRPDRPNSAAEVPGPGREVVRLSAALGESAEAEKIADDVPDSFSFAKVGPSGCDSSAALVATWRGVRDRLPATVELVAVAYADHRQAGCISPEQVFGAAKEFGLAHVLIDTFTKDGVSTRQHLGDQRLADLCRLARRKELWLALAGSIRGHDIEEMRGAGIEPDCVGVRGAVCRDDRTSVLDPDLLAGWRERVCGRHSR